MEKSNGPLKVIPGSGKNGHLALDIPNNREKALKKGGAITLELKAGSVVFINPYTIHGSEANTSNFPRRVFINGYALPGANKFIYPGCGKGRNIQVVHG